MTLIDTDKNSPDRSNPTLNASDVLSPGAVKGHATEGIAYRTEDTIDRPRVISKDDQIIVFDGSANKALFGRDGSGNYVVKVAEDGVDVLTASNDELIFNSAQNIFKIASSGTLTYAPPNSGSPSFNISVGTYSTSVPHGLAQRPGIIAFFKSNLLANFTNVETLMPFSWNNGTSTNLLINIYPTVDSTNVNFNFDFSATTGAASEINFTVRYYILQETAS